MENPSNHHMNTEEPKVTASSKEGFSLHVLVPWSYGQEFTGNLGLEVTNHWPQAKNIEWT